MSTAGDETLAKKLFPGVEFSTLLYVGRLAWFRYAFFIATTSLFVLMFAFAIVYQNMTIEFGDNSLLYSWIGLAVSPLIPGLYLWRWRRGGYVVDSTALYLREGFFFEKVRIIKRSSIRTAKKVQEKRFNLPAMGHIKLDLANGEQIFVLDVNQPQLLLKAIEGQK